MQSIDIQRINKLVFELIKWFFGIIGAFSCLLIILSFTDLPYNAYHWLGTSISRLNGRPDVIVLLGGSGMPSPDGLMRTYYAAEEAAKYPDAPVIIAHPLSPQDSLLQLQIMAHELVVKGIDSSRITFEPNGYNTHSQAVNVASMFPGRLDSISLLIITSPEHMYRAVRTFKKCGFKNVGGFAAFEKPVDEGQVSDKETSKSLRVKSISLRYNIWSYMVYELLVVKESIAIVYYKMKRWI
jgi:uncharacterized SAM-binding protein YcdF (DUF218 family)